MYGLCRLRDPATGAPRIVLISWVSAGRGLLRGGAGADPAASHLAPGTAEVPPAPSPTAARDRSRGSGRRRARGGGGAAGPQP